MAQDCFGEDRANRTYKVSDRRRRRRNTSKRQRNNIVNSATKCVIEARKRSELVEIQMACEEDVEEVWRAQQDKEDCGTRQNLFLLSGE